MTPTTISILQALQLVALVPSLFLVVQMFYLTSHFSRVVVPAIFFVTLMCSFAQPVLVLTGSNSSSLEALLYYGQMLQPALSFLLILQFLRGRTPNPVYWLVLTVPLIGSLTLMLSSMRFDDICLTASECMPLTSALTLYNVFASSLIFLLLMTILLRAKSDQPESNPILRQHKYWLVIALVCLNLLQLGDDLAVLAGKITTQQHEFISTVLRVAFIYLVQTSIFRVFDQSMSFGVATAVPPKREFTVSPDLVARIEQAMQQQLYREPELSRDSLAEILSVGEQALSRTINQHFGCNFSEYINSYRIEEAKARLANESTPVTAIAFEVGFNSIASFNRVFRQLVGNSPTEYRAKNTVVLKESALNA